MLAPQGEAPHGEPFEPLVPPLDALVDRLRRRNTALERQVGARIEQVDALRAELAEAHRQLAASREGEARAWREVERLRAEHEALMNTLTMRILRRPRDWYGASRRRLARP